VNFKKTLLIIIILIAAGLVVYKNIQLNKHYSELEKERTEMDETFKESNKKRLPKLIDIGAASCVPCKMMKPIIEEFQRDYTEFFETEYIDLTYPQNQFIASRYGVRVIPTIIFFDELGNEKHRHEGFISKEDVLAVWKRLGIKVEK